MNTTAIMSVLNSHSRATWSVWTKHLARCAPCHDAMRRRDLPNVACTAGTAAYDEWCIADQRCSEQLKRERHHQTPVVPWGPEHS